MMIRVLIADDEPLARQSIRSMLDPEPDVQVVGECADGVEALSAVRRDQPDVLFLDIDMPGMNGLEVVEAAGPGAIPAIIFVTAYGQHVLRAFDVEALDYLLKPFGVERFRVAFQRARERVNGNGTQAGGAGRVTSLLERVEREQGEIKRLVAQSTRRHLQRFLVRAADRVFLLPVAEVDWIESAGNYLRLHAGADSHLVRRTMNEVEASLDPACFMRIHRSTIVNIDRVRELRPWFAGEYAVILSDGTELRLSRSYRERLAERMGREL